VKFHRIWSETGSHRSRLGEESSNGSATNQRFSIGPETAPAKIGWERIRLKLLILLASPTGFEPVLSP
jgi:hypothetical protein